MFDDFEFEPLGLVFGVIGFLFVFWWMFLFGNDGFWEMIDWFTKIAILVLAPVVSYFIAVKLGNRE